MRGPKKRVKSQHREDDRRSTPSDGEASETKEAGRTSKPQPQKVSAVATQIANDGSAPLVNKANGHATIDPSLSLTIERPVDSLMKTH